jgi:hypothetical protein
MRRVLTDNNQVAATTAGSQEHGVRHVFLQLTLVTLMLIAASPGKAVIGAELTSPASEQDAKAADAAASPDSGKAASEAPLAKGPDPKWQPPPMPEPAPFANVDLPPEQIKELADKWGVELLGMRLTTAGYMLDFRFRVMDADKALPLFDHRIKPHIVAERSNIKLPVPMSTKVGAFRPTNRGKNIKADKTYYMIFGNPDRHVKVGEKVTVVIGDFKVEHLMVN